MKKGYPILNRDRLAASVFVYVVVIILFLFIALSGYGYVNNIIILCATEVLIDGVTIKEALRIVGIFFPPLGVVMGYVT